MPTNPQYFPVVHREITRLTTILTQGLHPVYEASFDNFLYDYFPDFSWTTTVMMQQVAEVEADPRWRSLAAQVKAKHGFDFINAHDAIRRQAAEFGA